MLLSQFLKRRVHALVVASLVILTLIVLRVRYVSLPAFTYVEQALESPELDELPTNAQAERPLTASSCPAELDAILKLKTDLRDTVNYSRKCIKPIWNSQGNRSLVTKLDGRLIGPTTTFDLTSCQDVQLPTCESIELTVPYPYPEQNYSHLIIGVATNYERLEYSLEGFAHWLSGTEAQLIVVVMDEEGGPRGSSRLPTLTSLYEAQGINIKAMVPRNSTLGVAQNHFTILAEMLDAATPDTQWLGIIDDDTFIPSLYRLSEELKTHDHTRPAWLGALSEDFDVVKWLGMMAFGGAGTFLSVPLVRGLVPHIPDCLELPRAIAKNATGDGLLRDCIFEHTNTKLTLVEGLYQHDIRGDVSGFYESGIQPLSVHHWRSWYKIPMPKIAAVTKVCGDCFLQRWQFGEDILFTNGFSVTQYVDGLDGIDLTQMEGTWSNPGHEFDFSLGPLRPALEEGKKKSFKLVDAVMSEEGLRQIYVMKSYPEDGPDSVLEIIWETGQGLVH